MEEQIYKELESKYKSVLQISDWYLQLQSFLDEYFYSYETNNEGKPESWKWTRTSFVNLIANMLDEGSLALGKAGLDMDAERHHIDTAVIHHTSTAPEYSLSYVEALILLRLYTKQYADRSNEYYGKPLWSGHFYNGRQTFHAYHYLIAPDGTVHHVLEDRYIGWQAGNWNINCRSIAIAFMDELKEKSPTKEALHAAKRIIEQYPEIKVIGHNEVNTSTICPGNQFDEGEVWKKQLLS